MIADAIRQAQAMHRAAIAQTYDSSCNVYVQVSVKDPETKATYQEESLLLEGLPCHLAFSGHLPAAESETAAGIGQAITLYLDPEPVIPPGSRLEVSSHGRTESYSRSGQAAVYATHQEISLELWKRYA